MKYKVCWRDLRLNKGGSLIGKFDQAQATRLAKELQERHSHRCYWTELISKAAWYTRER